MRLKFSSKGVNAFATTLIIIASIVSAAFIAGKGQSQTSYTPDDFFTTLIENKADLTYGYAIFDFKNALPTSLSVDANSFKITTADQSGATPIQNMAYYVLKNATYSQNVTDYTIQCENFISPNGTQDKLCSAIAEGWHWNNYTSQVWQPFTSYTFLAGQTYRIKVHANWAPRIGSNSREWFPQVTIASVTYQQDKWAWWNIGWSYCRNITLNNSGIAYSKTWEYQELNVDSSSWNNKPYNDSIRIVSSSCDNGGGEIPYQIVNVSQSSGQMASFVVKFLENVTANSNSTYAVYYDTNSKGSPNYNGTNGWPYVVYASNFTLPDGINQTIAYANNLVPYWLKYNLISNSSYDNGNCYTGIKSNKLYMNCSTTGGSSSGVSIRTTFSSGIISARVIYNYNHISNGYYGDRGAMGDCWTNSTLFNATRFINADTCYWIYGNSTSGIPAYMLGHWDDVTYAPAEVWTPPVGSGVALWNTNPSMIRNQNVVLERFWLNSTHYNYSIISPVAPTFQTQILNVTAPNAPGTTNQTAYYSLLLHSNDQWENDELYFDNLCLVNEVGHTCYIDENQTQISIGSEQSLAIIQSMKRLFFSGQSGNVINITSNPPENFGNIVTNILFKNESGLWQQFQTIPNSSYQRLGNGQYQATFDANKSLGQYIANTTLTGNGSMTKFTYFNVTYPELYSFIDAMCGGCVSG